MTNVNNSRVEFGRVVRRLRKGLGLTQQELASRAEMSTIYLGTIENGKRDPSMSTILSLAAALGVSVPELIGPHPPPNLSPAARAMANLFEEAPVELQTAILAVLHAIAATNLGARRRGR
jgi:transcriptional regulator with XRE-family HTH domain